MDNLTNRNQKLLMYSLLGGIFILVLIIFLSITRIQNQQAMITASQAVENSSELPGKSLDEQSPYTQTVKLSCMSAEISFGYSIDYNTYKCFPHGSSEACYYETYIKCLGMNRASYQAKDRCTTAKDWAAFAEYFCCYDAVGGPQPTSINPEPTCPWPDPYCGTPIPTAAPPTIEVPSEPPTSAPPTRSLLQPIDSTR